MPPNDREADLDVPLSAQLFELELWQNRMLNSPDHLFKKKSTRVGFLNFTGLLKRHKSSGQAAYHWANWVLHIQMVVRRALYLTIRVCGLNPRCWVPERSTLPTCKDILRTFPIREFQGDHMGFSLDVKAAHKRIVLHEREQGLVGFTLGGKLFFYRVTPSGAVFSAHWWARLGGLLLRIFTG